MPAPSCWFHGKYLLWQSLLLHPFLFPAGIIWTWLATASSISVCSWPWRLRKKRVEGLGYPVRWGTALVPLIFAAEVVDGWTGWWSLLRHGKIWLLLLTEFINSGEVSPVLSMAVEAAPSCGAVGAVVCSTSWPVCQSGGPSATPSWRSSLLRRQVVSSPTT